MSDTMKRVVALAELLERQRAREQELTAALAEAKAERGRTEREDLPQLMMELGLAEIRLESGKRVKVEKDVHCSITAAKQPQAIRWLVDNGYGGLVKTEVAVAFERGAHDEALALAQQLVEERDGVNLKEVVHPATLKSWVKERLEQGDDFPWDLFSVNPFDKATIK